MEEPFREMYICLYKDLEALQRLFYKLASEADENLLKTSDMYLAHLQQHTDSQEDLEAKFADLYQGI